MSAIQMPTHSSSATDFTIPLNSMAGIAGNQEQSLFRREELLQFAADDSNVGRHVGAILASIFVYTVIAMSIAGCWTYLSVGH